MIILKQNRSCSPTNILATEATVLGQLITSTKRAMVPYSSPAFLWANIHLLLLVQEINVQLFCLLLIEKTSKLGRKRTNSIKKLGYFNQSYSNAHSYRDLKRCQISSCFYLLECTYKEEKHIVTLSKRSVE